MLWLNAHDAFAIRLVIFFHAKSGVEKDRKEVDLFRDKAVKSRRDRRDTAVIYPLDVSYRESMIPLEDPAVDRNPNPPSPP